MPQALGGVPISGPVATASSFDVSSSIVNLEDLNGVSKIYNVTPTNWYKAKPYGFMFSSRGTQSESKSIIFWLPISPENIQVVTHYATNVVTTLYGVVEEHSEVRYYDITIQGTTGYAPKYFDHNKAGEVNEGRSTGRDSFQGGGLLEKIPLPGGIGAGALNAAQQLINSTTDAINAVQGGAATKTGVDINKSGYVAFHNFYKFLIQYKRDTSGQSFYGFQERKIQHPLQFLNYKDSIKYDCVPINFTLNRSAEDPMLYNYVIKLRAYNLRGVNDTDGDKGTTDEFLAKLGLGANTVDQFNNALGAVGGAIRNIGSLF